MPNMHVPGATGSQGRKEREESSREGKKGPVLSTWDNKQCCVTYRTKSEGTGEAGGAIG